ncbi:MAG: hypothetical protein P9L92_00095 [Candidatus Electryonea clarkiae]|nr:hypothetical protein [Candidatus Electryonea clarkiae]MDP8287423.1 hypothetical protein [Candidatus Electryonea clarkiae]
MDSYLSAPSRKRISIPISDELHVSLTRLARQNKTTVAKIGREAIQKFIKKKQWEERQKKLAETCTILEEISDEITRDWAVTEVEEWPE